VRIKLLLSVVLAMPALAETEVWLLGGGNALDASQEQIEANVRWLEELLLANGLDVRTYFALGEHPGVDVAYRQAGETHPGGDPWSQVFGDADRAAVRYRRHDLRAVRGSMYKDELVESLMRDFAQLSPDDELLLVYNGHGGLVASDTRDNYLKLWGDERLTVSELDALLDAAPRDTTARFVMAQCYAGGFHALIYDDPREAEGFSGKRCGFMAESDVRQAEGCGLDLDQDEFRDYTTYFFAALNGASRFGEPLPLAAVDRDRDGAVSYREAHFHALVTAHSTDLSRSTSEQFLEDWSPWYLRWDSLADNPGSVYWQLASDVAMRNGWRPVSEDLNRARGQFRAALTDTEQQRIDGRRRLGTLRAGLRADMTARWPALADAESSTALGEDWSAVAAAVESDTRYGELERERRSLSRLGEQLREQKRTLTQTEKVYRLRHLARLERALQTYGSAEARERYGRLVECESGSLETAEPPSGG
jgi:hypothetical protein